MPIFHSEPTATISDNDIVTVTRMNHHLEVRHMEKENRGATIRKISKEEYILLSTGEVHKFSEPSETRNDNHHSLRQTLKRLRYLINNNFTGAGNELFLTLTYAENMRDTNRLLTDFEKFIKKIKYNYTDVDYLNIVEPQRRGAWHCHVLLRFNNRLDKVFIPADKLAKWWGQGFINVKALKNVDNLGAYLSAYLANIELDEGEVPPPNTEVLEKVIDGHSKRFIKGGRLNLYPVGMNLYRKSKGITEPERAREFFSEIKKEVGSQQPNFQKTITLQQGEFTNIIKYQQYNLKRKIQE